MAPSYGSCRTEVQESKATVLPYKTKIVLGVAALALVALAFNASSLSKVVILGQEPAAVHKNALWGAGDAREERPLKQSDTTAVGDITADETVDKFDTPLVDVAHADCSKDTDPDCQNSVNPLFDKQRSGGKVLARKPTKFGLSAKAATAQVANLFSQPAAQKQHYRAGQMSSSEADQALQQYFSDESLLASTPQKPIKAATPEHPHAHAPPKFGVSGSAARKDFDKYFTKKAAFPPAPYVGFSTSAADADLKAYFSQQLEATPAIKHAPADGRGMSSKAAQQDMSSYFSGLQQTASNALPQSAPRDAIFKTVKQHEQEVELAKHSLSTAAANSDLQSYFAKQAQVAAEPRHAHKAARALPAPVDAAPKFGVSAEAARRELQRYFAAQQPAPAHSEKHGISGAAARRSFDKYFAAQTQKAAHTAAASKRQTLASYGVGPEDDNAVEVGKAYGVGKQLPGPPVFQSNQAPDPKLIQEVNQAIDSQRIEGYSNGNSAPVESIVFPPP